MKTARQNTMSVQITAEVNTTAGNTQVQATGK